MFDGFLRSKFVTKSKSALKLMKVRIEGIKRKRNAMQKYLKNDISDLIRNGFLLNAYGRAEGPLVEMNKSVGYDFIEQFCKTISEHLSVMNKQKECPEECKEAVSSLMFAAARFADLPELRELRTIFADRYGKSVDTHVNKEFVEKLKVSTPTKDAKLQLLQDIATEYGVEWDAKSLENQLFKPPITEQIHSKNTDQSEIETKKNRIRPVREIEKQELEISHAPKMREKSKVPSSDDKYEPRDIEINANIVTTEENIAKENSGDKKSVSYRLIPPPYTKSNSNNSMTSSEVPSQDGSVGETKQKPKSVRRRQLKLNEDPGFKLVLKDSDEDKNENRKGFHSRTISLPPEEKSPSETKKGHARASSYQPNYEQAHPKLLDYDDFVARLAALRQN